MFLSLKRWLLNMVKARHNGKSQLKTLWRADFN